MTDSENLVQVATDDESTTPVTETPEVEETATEEDMFPRKYVEELRSENASYRTKANGLAERLHTSLVAATGRLADPADLPFDEAHIDDEAALVAAIDSLLASKPHLASRRVVGDVGQGARPTSTNVGLGSLLRAHV